MKRRNFIRLLGTTTCIYAAQLPMGQLAFASEDLPNPAQPWHAAGSRYSEPRLRALSYAILAPNPHNRQPWQVKLIGDDQLELYCDLERRLPITDPYDRQITIGLGCFLELLQLAAAEDGWQLETTLFPEGEPQPRLNGSPIAHVTFVRGASADPLFRHIQQRRSTKEPFNEKPIAPDVLAELLSVSPLLKASGDKYLATALRELTVDAFDRESRTPDALKESIDLMRIGDPAIAKNPDGIDLGGPRFTKLFEDGVLTKETIGKINSPVFEYNLSAQLKVLSATHHYIWLVTPGNSRQDQIRAGRDYVRTNLAATAMGLAMHPTSQALQEYEEVAPHYTKVNELLGVENPHRIQMLARLGYGPEVKPSPRWPVEARVVKG